MGKDHFSTSATSMGNYFSLTKSFGTSTSEVKFGTSEGAKFCIGFVIQKVPSTTPEW